MAVSNDDVAFATCIPIVGGGPAGACGSDPASPLRPAPTLSVRPDGDLA